MSRDRAGRPTSGTAVREVERLQLTLRAGVDLLRRGEVVQAQQVVREALALRPGQPQAKNLMALTFFYDGAWESACDIFDGLARRNGDAVALRVNAGLSALKSGRVDLAVGHLQRAIDLNPGHRRAFGYLALIHLETGDRELARAALLEADLAGLAEAVVDGASPGGALAPEIWEALAQMSSSGGLSADVDDLLEEFIEAQWPPPKAIGEVSERREHTAGSRRPSTAWEAVTTEKTFEEETRQLEDPEGERLGGELVEGDPSGAASAPLVSARAARRHPVVSAPQTEEMRQEQPLMDTEQGWLRLWPRAGRQGCPAVIRGDLLVSARGAVSFDTVQRRAKGVRAGPFEINGAPLWLLGGEGEAEVRVPSAMSVTVLDLSQHESVLYLREEALGAFAGTLHWENGVLPEHVACVRFCGTGPVAVVHSGELHRLELSGDAPVLVRCDALCGWIGEVVVSWAGISAPQGLRLYRCEGRGVALVDCGSMGRGRTDVSMKR